MNGSFWFFFVHPIYIWLNDRNTSPCNTMQLSSITNYSLRSDDKVESTPLKQAVGKKLKTISFMKIQFIAGLFYWTALVLAWPNKPPPECKAVLNTPRGN